jgi:hypothetical protein
LRALSLWVKRPGHEADHSPPTSAEVKNAWSYISTPLYVFMAWCLVKHRDNFTFTFVWIGNLVSHRKGRKRFRVFENRVQKRIFGPKRQQKAVAN